MKLVCFFRHPETDSQRSVEVEGVSVAKSGFWINGAGQVTVGADCLYWIPPAQVYGIKRVASGDARKCSNCLESGAVLPLREAIARACFAPDWFAKCEACSIHFTEIEFNDLKK